MNLPARSSKPWLLAALPLAWATSVVLVVEQDTLLLAAIGLAWFCLAWKCSAGRRAIVAGRTLALLIAVALPAQGFAVIAAEVSGPAHFHAVAKAGAPHWHVGVMHHHHALGEAVIVDDGKRSKPALEETKRTAFGAVDALAATAPAVPPMIPACGAPPASFTEPSAHVARLPERPPRLPSAFLPS
jgi:hypothetical protein